MLFLLLKCFLFALATHGQVQETNDLASSLCEACKRTGNDLSHYSCHRHTTREYSGFGAVYRYGNSFWTLYQRCFNTDLPPEGWTHYSTCKVNCPAAIYGDLTCPGPHRCDTHQTECPWDLTKGFKCMRAGIAILNMRYAECESCIVQEYCQDPASDPSCNFYEDCVEKRLECGSGEDGYALAYGKKYCNNYNSPEVDGMMSENMKEWRDCVRICLQEALVPHLKDPELTCQNVSEIAFESHPNCYTDCGVCNLVSIKLNRAIYKAVCDDLVCYNQLKDKRFWVQSLKTMKQCASSSIAGIKMTFEKALSSGRALASEIVEDVLSVVDTKIQSFVDENIGFYPKDFVLDVFPGNLDLLNLGLPLRGREEKKGGRDEDAGDIQSYTLEFYLMGNTNLDQIDFGAGVVEELQNILDLEEENGIRFTQVEEEEGEEGEEEEGGEE